MIIQRIYTPMILLVLLIMFACTGTISKRQFLLVAHRGGVVDESHSENSLKGLEEAIHRGYTHVEVDVRVTKDGHAVCFHDNNLMRKTGVDKKISDLTLNELKGIQLNRSKETIPAFDEYCVRCERRINLMVDTKGVPDHFVEQYCREIETALTTHGLLKDALFIMDGIPKNNQDKVGEWFMGKSRVSLRTRVDKAKELQKSMPGKLADYYFVFNSCKHFTKQDIDDFHKMGLLIIPSINTAHYKTGEPVKQGLADVRQMLEWGVDGLQIDSCFDPLVFKYLQNGELNEL